MSKKQFQKKVVKDYNIKIEDVQPINPQFSKCNIYILYTGKNRNYTAFTKEVVENAIFSLKNIPIIGEYNETVEDFKGHGGKIILDDEGVQYIQTTKPYGVVPESAEFVWEEIEEDGVKREYLVAKGCLLWTGRYSEANTVIEKGTGQSMEINVNDGYYTDDDVLNITDFTFSALCLLGEGYEPCFEGAKATAYTLNKEEFNAEFTLMLDEVKKINFEENPNEDTNDNNDEGKAEDGTNEPVAEEGEPEIPNENSDEGVKAESENTNEGENTNEPENTNKPVENNDSNDTGVTEGFENKQFMNMVEQFNTMITQQNNTIKDLNNKITSLTDYNTRVEEENQKLKCQLENLEKDKLFERFAKCLTAEEIKGIQDKRDEYSKEEINNQLNALLSNKVLNSKNFSLNDGFKVSIPKQSENKNIYGM